MLYLHVKGMRNNGDITSVADWRRYMVYFLAERWELCLGLLSSGQGSGTEYHMCGVQDNGEEYAGNMWWSSARWLAQTRGVLHVHWNMNNRYEAEDFLFRQKEGSILKRKSYCMFEIGHNMYDCPTPKDLYTDNNAIPVPLRQESACYRPPNIKRHTKNSCFVLRSQD